jgi:hypothetical protein
MDGMEREAAGLYRAAKLDILAGAAPSELVEALLGRGAIRWLGAPWVEGGGSIARVGSEWRIYLREDLPRQRLRFVLLHELSHWALGPSATEVECDQLAACLLAPKPAFELALAAGRTYTRLARWFGCTETFAALRYGEVTDQPLVVVAPATVRIRGRAWSWPASEPELRSLVKSRKPGLSKARLRDDPMRVALRVG